MIEEELTALELDAARPYDNWFIETCDEWTVPYIGDLVGARPIRPVPSAGVSMRAWVANTLAYRRRKGTALVLEQLARDVTYWPATAVEFFQRLATTQHEPCAPRPPQPPPACATPHAPSWPRPTAAFDPYAHTLEVRNADTRRPPQHPQHRHLPWRLRAQPLGQGVPGEAMPTSSAHAIEWRGWWPCTPPGVDAPLFNRPRTETGAP